MLEGAQTTRNAEIAARIAAAVELQAVTIRKIAENVHAATGSAAHVAADIAEVSDLPGACPAAVNLEAALNRTASASLLLR